ncbi:Serine/threonine-protein kinase 4 [Conglomerata obtusa]
MFYYIAPDPIVFEFNWQNVSEKIEKNVCKHILYIKNGLACKYFLGDLSLRFTYMRTILQPLSTRALCDFDDPCYIGKVIEAYDPTNTKSRLLIIKNILRDILKAIDFLHANYTTHLQINPNSIVICKDGITNIYRLICYDNMCKYNKESETIKSNPIVSEPNLDEFDDARSIDIFQLGVTGISFYLGKTFYKDIEENVEKLEDLQKNVDAFLTKNNITGDFYDFLINCLQKDPQLYKNAQELLQHPFLKDDCNCDDLQPQ